MTANKNCGSLQKAKISSKETIDDEKNVHVSEAIINFLISKGVKDVFGYPGGMVVRILESLRNRQNDIHFVLSFSEQGAAFEACAWAQTTGKTGVAIATSGPGATNLITGIANAYFDSIPVVFITGQVNKTESSKGYNIRQRGFQETQIVDIVKPITKAAFYAENGNDCMEKLQQAFEIAQEGRKGPVLIDVPMDVQREFVSFDTWCSSNENSENKLPIIPEDKIQLLNQLIKSAKRPVFIFGNGIKESSYFNFETIRKTSDFSIPIVLSLPAIDLLPTNQFNNFGLVGAYGKREANIILSKADLVVSFGARLDVRQVGGIRSDFAPKAQIVRIDIDTNETNYKIRDNDIILPYDANLMLNHIDKQVCDKTPWMKICCEIKELLQKENVDNLPTQNIVRKLGAYLSDDAIITTDVGQNQIWIAQSFPFIKQHCLTSSGLGSMGYSLPASIGSYYACGGKKQVVSFNGDGGIQMNIQELGVICRDQLPIKVVVFNNEALGMIRAFQEVYFGHYFMTTKGTGFSNPDYSKIAEAYNMEYCFANDPNKNYKDVFALNKPVLIEIGIAYLTYVYPKLMFKENNDNQFPYLPADFLSKIRKM